MSDYARLQVSALPRLPLAGHLDLTYRCNNACLHCWLWKSPHAAEQQNELSCFCPYMFLPGAAFSHRMHGFFARLAGLAPR